MIGYIKGKRKQWCVDQNSKGGGVRTGGGDEEEESSRCVRRNAEERGRAIGCAARGGGGGSFWTGGRRRRLLERRTRLSFIWDSDFRACGPRTYWSGAPFWRLESSGLIFPSQKTRFFKIYLGKKYGFSFMPLFVCFCTHDKLMSLSTCRIPLKQSTCSTRLQFEG